MIGLAMVAFSRLRSRSLDPFGTGILLALNIAIPFLIIARPSTPIFGGIKHWFAALPYLCLLIAVGIAQLQSALRRQPMWMGRAFASTCLLCITAGGAVASWQCHPFGISYYNELLGGITGGADARAMRQFWGYESRHALEWLDEHAPTGSQIHWHETTGYAVDMYREEGWLRPDLQNAWSIQSASFVVYEHDKGQTIEYIQSYGIDMQDPQHAPQLGPWLFWVSQAHARGIKLGGTMLDRMNEPESDAGTRPLRLAIGEAMALAAENKQAEGRTDYTVVTIHSPAYQAEADRLAARCDALGLAHEFRCIPDGETKTEFFERYSQQGTPFAQAVAKKTGRPALWIDADDELLTAPTLPTGDNWGLGWIMNPEKQVIETDLTAGNVWAVWPTAGGDAACRIIMANVGVGVGHHRALCAAVAATCGCYGGESRYGTVDITRHVKGCIKINPGRRRPAACRT
jgi:hypothetical protein